MKINEKEAGIGPFFKKEGFHPSEYCWWKLECTLESVFYRILPTCHNPWFIINCSQRFREKIYQAVLSKFLVLSFVRVKIWQNSFAKQLSVSGHRGLVINLIRDPSHLPRDTTHDFQVILHHGVRQLKCDEGILHEVRQLKGDEGSYLPKGKLLCLWNYKTIEKMHEEQ